MGAWMNRASIGLFRVEGYWYSVKWIDKLIVRLTTYQNGRDLHIDDVNKNDNLGSKEEL